MPNNYDTFSGVDDPVWPEYVSERELQGDYLQKAEQILDMALVTLETYDGPRYIVDKLLRASRSSVYLYQINALLIESSDVVHECNATILYEPWMKANCIAQAVFEFVDDEENKKIVVRRRDEVPYYKNVVALDGDAITPETSYIPLRIVENAGA
ncbi:uncharacterized protein LOC106087740 [Stomoxys calcitrans]|uniref:uncharacterized protein LOC106087740 n=1 Tax=Stomoxys calcitrans TaxID=35570 RepID=UPI0027E25B34|nr:uncharacterized protein LOC106087740 [Stomoxys calcitrans]